jgi:hypothetical protein
MKGYLVRSMGVATAVAVASTWAAASFGQDEAPLPRPPPPAPTEVLVPTYHGPNRGMMGSGFLVFGMAYVPAVVVAAQSTQAADQKLYIPVAGPWLDLASRPSCAGATAAAAVACDNDAGNRALIAIDGIFQGLGALFVAGSLFVPEHPRAMTTAQAEARPRVHISPAHLGPGGYGVAATGSF